MLYQPFIRRLGDPDRTLTQLRRRYGAGCKGPKPVLASASSLLDCLDLAYDDHVLLIGDDTLDIMCALLRRGCGAVTVLRPHEAVRPEPAELVLAPAVTDTAAAQHALALARRALGPGGRLVLSVPRAASAVAAEAIAQLLRGPAFGRLHCRYLPGAIVFSTELPCFWTPRAASVVAARAGQGRVP